MSRSDSTGDVDYRREHREERDASYSPRPSSTQSTHSSRSYGETRKEKEDASYRRHRHHSPSWRARDGEERRSSRSRMREDRHHRSSRRDRSRDEKGSRHRQPSRRDRSRDEEEGRHHRSSRRERSREREYHRPSHRSSRRDRSRERRKDRKRRTRDFSDTEEEEEREERRRRRERKREKRAKRREEENPGRPSKYGQWGAYGVLHDADIYPKEQEFHAWLLDIQGISPETTSNQELKQHFRTFMEDYNTVTLPHEKYYNLEAWEAKERLRPSATSSGNPETAGSMDLFQEQRNASMQAAAHEGLSNPTAVAMMSRQEVEDLRRVQHERTAAANLQRMGYTPKASLGVRYEK